MNSTSDTYPFGAAASAAWCAAYLDPGSARALRPPPFLDGPLTAPIPPHPQVGGLPRLHQEAERQILRSRASRDTRTQGASHAHSPTPPHPPPLLLPSPTAGRRRLVQAVFIVAGQGGQGQGGRRRQPQRAVAVGDPGRRRCEAAVEAGGRPLPPRVHAGRVEAWLLDAGEGRLRELHAAQVHAPPHPSNGRAALDAPPTDTHRPRLALLRYTPPVYTPPKYTPKAAQVTDRHRHHRRPLSPPPSTHVHPPPPTTTTSYSRRRRIRSRW